MKNLHLLATVYSMPFSFSPILRADEPYTGKHQTKSDINKGFSTTVRFREIENSHL